MQTVNTNVKLGKEGEDGFRDLSWDWRQDGHRGRESAEVRLLDMNDGTVAVYEKPAGYPLLPLRFRGVVSVRVTQKKRERFPEYDPEDRVLAENVAQAVWNGPKGTYPRLKRIESAERIAAANLAKKGE